LSPSQPEDSTGLRALALGLFELDVVAACRRLERIDDVDAVAVLTTLPHEVTVRAFGHLHAPQAAALLRDAPPALFRALAEHMEPQQAADVLLRLPSDERERLIENLPERQRRQVQELLTYPAESAGRAMTTDFLAFHTDINAADAIERMRDLAHKNALSSYTYVVDAEDRLAGVINIRDLFGVASTRSSKRIELVVQLERWEAGREYDRLGLDEERFEILGVPVPMIRMPVAPGRNVAILVEVAARNQLLRARGHHAARALAARLDRALLNDSSTALGDPTLFGAAPAAAGRLDGAEDETDRGDEDDA